MTAAAGEGPRSFDRFMAWISHYTVGFIVSSFFIQAAQYVVPDGMSYWPLGSIPLVLLLVGMVGQHVHHHRIYDCKVCSRRFPWNGEAIADKRQFVFRLTHKPLPVVLVWFCMIMGGPLLAVIHVISFTVSGIVSAAANLVWGFQMWCSDEHNRLVPWCPICRRRGGGGHHEHAPDPIPSGTKENA